MIFIFSKWTRGAQMKPFVRTRAVIALGKECLLRETHSVGLTLLL